MLDNEMYMTKENLAIISKELRSGISRLLSDRLDAIYLYGSYARSNVHPDSNIDVLVVIRGDFNYFDLIQRSGALISQLSLENDKVTALAFVAKKDYEIRQVPFLMNVRRERIPVWKMMKPSFWKKLKRT